jgi:hypothetical protein
MFETNERISIKFVEASTLNVNCRISFWFIWALRKFFYLTWSSKQNIACFLESDSSYKVFLREKYRSCGALQCLFATFLEIAKVQRNTKKIFSEVLYVTIDAALSFLSTVSKCQ